jgi:hypothetical protein
LHSYHGGSPGGRCCDCTSSPCHAAMHATHQTGLMACCRMDCSRGCCSIDSACCSCIYPLYALRAAACCISSRVWCGHCGILQGCCCSIVCTMACRCGLLLLQCCALSSRMLHCRIGCRVEIQTTPPPATPHAPSARASTHVLYVHMSCLLCQNVKINLV